jgi:hypothetical protein
MPILNSRSSRFARTSSYTAPEHRAPSLHSARTRLSLVAPTHPVRGKDAPAAENTKKG